MANKNYRKDLDILGAYQSQVKGVNRKSREMRFVLGALIVIAFLLLGLFYVKVQIDRKNIAAEADSLRTQMEAENYAERQEQAAVVSDALSMRQSYNEVLEYHIQALNEMYRPDSALFMSIERMAVIYGVNCSMLTYLDENITLQCTSANASKAAEFAKALEAELMDDVTFYGYTLEEMGNVYVFSVEGIRKGA